MTNSIQQRYSEVVGVPFQDNLTGLFNFGYFQQLLEQELKLSRQEEKTFAFILANVDDFSRFNRRWGSIKGDRLLMEIALAIKDSLREIDVAARYAEDTFAIILTETTERSLRRPLENIFKQIADKIDSEITISAGIIICPTETSNLQSITYKAKQALKRAKLQGKNRYVIADTSNLKIEKERPTILVVDDVPLNTKLLSAIFSTEGFQVISAHSGAEALEILTKEVIDLVLLDIIMPEMDGFEVCRIIKESEHSRKIPVIMVTALDDTEAKVKSIKVGANDFHTKPSETIELLARVRSLIQIKTLNENMTSIENVIFSFANAVESKDLYTQGHVSRVSELADMLGQRLHLSKAELRSLRIGGALHDLGKIAVRDEILNKNGALNESEWEIIRQHPIIGEKIAMPLQHSMGLSLDIIRHHHEKLDGSGYPDGLQGDEISIPARIMSIVDIFDALTTDRPYRSAMQDPEAFTLLLEGSEQGKLDPHIVNEFIAMIKEL